MKNNRVKNIPLNWVNQILPVSSFISTIINVLFFFQKLIERILFNVVESIRMRLKRRAGCFGLYGCDFMIDEQMKVWLIEINVNPSLTTNTKTLLQAIPPVVHEAIRTFLFSPLLFSSLWHRTNSQTTNFNSTLTTSSHPHSKSPVIVTNHFSKT